MGGRLKQHIYDEPEDRWLVELRVSYADSDDVPDARTAAAAALSLTTDLGSCHTVWVVTDRRTGHYVQFEQCDLEGVEIT